MSRIPWPTISLMTSAPASPEGHAHADLRPPLRDRVGHHAVEADGREHQREGCEAAEQE